jgi:apolipoprotein D and lipocalin family protein
VERYDLNADGSIATTFTYHQGSANGPLKIYHPIGYVKPDSNNAVWGMQFIWPIKAEYIIAHLDAEYQTTIIARNKRDYVWLMARQSHLNEADYQALVKKIAEMGYDIKQLVKIPHTVAQ